MQFTRILRLIGGRMIRNSAILSQLGQRISLATCRCLQANPKGCKLNVQINPQTHSWFPTAQLQFRYMSTVQDVTISDVVKGVLEDSNISIDVRDPNELAESGTIGQSLNLPLGELEEILSLSEDAFRARYNRAKPDVTATNLIVFCKAGVRAAEACEIFQKHGYSSVKRFPGSMDEWEDTLLGSRAADRQPKPA